MVLAVCQEIELLRSIRSRTLGAAHIPNAAYPHKLRSDVWTICSTTPLEAERAEHSASRFVPLAGWSGCASARNVNSESRGHEQRGV
jgi:hypothetical protein